MKEEPFIKLSWMVYKKEMLKNIPLLTKEDPKKIYRNAKRLYKQELKQLEEYGTGDVLKFNLLYGIMIYTLVVSCETKPGVNELRQFCRNVVLTPKLARTFLAKTDMTCEKNIQHQIQLAEKSSNAAHPYTWQYKITEIGNKRFTAEFSRCGIYDYFKAKGLSELVPAICMMDFCYCEVQNHIFLRKETIASGGKVCDCTYISKDIASDDEWQEYQKDRKKESQYGQKITGQY